MPIKRTDRLGLTSPGRPGWNRPTTPRFCSPTRINNISVLLSLIRILSDGTRGSPRHVRNGEPKSEIVGGGTPRAVHSRPNAAMALGWARKNEGSFHTVEIGRA